MKKFLKSKLILSSSLLLSFTLTLATNEFYWICQTLDLIFLIYYVDVDNLVSIPSHLSLKWYVTCHDNPMSICVLSWCFQLIFIDHNFEEFFIASLVLQSNCKSLLWKKNLLYTDCQLHISLPSRLSQQKFWLEWE